MGFPKRKLFLGAMLVSGIIKLPNFVLGSKLMQILWVTFWEGDFPPKNLCIEVWGLVMFMIRPL